MNRTFHVVCPICGHNKLNPFLKTIDFTVSKEEYELLECESCGFVLTQNAPDFDHIGSYYKGEEYISHSNTKKGLFFKLYHRVREYMLKQKFNLIEQNRANVPEPKLLEIGTGRGYFLNYMQMHGYQSIGLEQDPEVRDIAAKEFSLDIREPNQLFKLEAKQFDVITLWHVLEHIHDFKVYLESIRQLLKSDGLLVIALPNPNAADAQFYSEYWSGWDLPIHLWHFKPKNVEMLMKQFQLEIIDRKALPFDPFYLSIISSKQKGDAIPFLKGMWNGWKAHRMAKKDFELTTSIIYLIKHQQ
ncbi:MAG: methyltransferase domain-containing protein [Bacteroidales bacterium]|nr:methyltransferase domain-containing protein [Bacteroidales bacterium]